MALTYLQTVNELGAWADLDVSSGSEGETTAKRAINWAARKIWTARFWYERRAVVDLYTLQPYSTGTADFTNLSTAVTGNGTTWTSGMTGAKIAKSLTSPWYRFTRTGNTTGTIAPATGYAEATSLLSTYVIYQDEYDVATDVDVIYDATCYRQEFGGAMQKVGEVGFDQGNFIHGITGIPRAYSITGSQTAGTRRIRVYPVPDTVYRIRLRYWKGWTDLSADGDSSALGANKELLLLQTAYYILQSLSDIQPRFTSEKIDALIEMAWREQQDAVPVSYVKQPFDAWDAGGGLWLDATNAWS